ncbi:MULTISPECIES: hypothetical protein [Mycolicibacterium]|uniref:hypothetical protein n=1 Tax=Mycolicibacterium TaxID=1866885 RepID=UPI001CFBC4DD|nr:MULTISPECIES: hypothetical protein [Mycolicibacterium]UCZ59718.1 hypothetical protein LHJ73_24035 [Mycolicibacterium phocaicum]
MTETWRQLGKKLIPRTYTGWVTAAFATLVAIVLIAYIIDYFSPGESLQRCTDEIVHKVQAHQMTTNEVLAGANNSHVAFTSDQLEYLSGLIAAAQQYCRNQ